ncbi:MAG: 4-hydroxy-tetrahydrodipicolinate synthase [Phycisphaerales bacterium]|nr:4-hydroxy-tetrahydrodipicolinate synthase [Phycisphaerales bacterium]
MIDFSGAYTALITPFSRRGDMLDLPRLTEQINRQASYGMTGVVPCGTTGETPTLTNAEYRIVVRHAIKTARNLQLTVIPGAGSNSTHHAIQLHQFCHDVGAHASLQVTPYYNRPSQEGIYRHFMAIADSCDLPVVLYNIPGRCGRLIELNTIKRLASHPNIAAIKDATGDANQAKEILTDTDLVLLSGDDPLTLPLMALGGGGVISVLSNILPMRVMSLVAACREARWEEAVSLHRRLLTLASTLLECDVNPVPIKTAMALLDWDSGTVRLPLCASTSEVVNQVREQLKACGLTIAATHRSLEQTA